MPQKHRQPIIPTNNIIRIMLHKTLTHMMMLLWKLQCTTMREMPWKGSVRILPCGLNSLLTGRIFWQTPPPIPIMKTSRKNYKQFMGDYSMLTPSNGFENQCLQNKKGLLPSVFSQAVILHVQTLEPSRNIYILTAGVNMNTWQTNMLPERYAKKVIMHYIRNFVDKYMYKISDGSSN